MSAFNEERFVRASVESILAQTFADFEFVVVDDGSTDSTSDILRSYDDPRLRLLTQPNAGYVAAWRRAIASSSSAWLARMDADDVSHPRRLEQQMEFLAAHPEVDVLGTAAICIDEHGDVMRYDDLVTHDRLIRAELRRGNPLYHGSVVMRRDTYDASGGYRSEAVPVEDYELWVRMALDPEVRFANLTDRLYEYRVHGRSITAQRIGEQRLRAAEVATVAAALPPQPIRTLVKAAWSERSDPARRPHIARSLSSEALAASFGRAQVLRLVAALIAPSRARIALQHRVRDSSARLRGGARRR